MVSRASSMEHMNSFGMPAGFKKSPFAFSGTGFAFGGARPEYIRKASTTSLTNGDLSAQKVSASGEIARAVNGFKDKANHLRSILAENEKSKAEEELSKRKEATKTEIIMRNEMDQRELLSAKARSSEILATQHSLMDKVIEDVKETLKEAYTKEIKEEVLAQYQRSTRTLKEDAKAEFIKQIAPDVKAELRLELRQEVRETVVMELNEELGNEFMKLKANLKGEVTSTLRAELASEVRTELKAMYTDSVKDELRGLYSDQIKDELRQKLVAELNAEAETDRKLKELVQREKELEAQLEDANERNPSVERGGFTKDAKEGNPSFERDGFAENVNERNPSAERDEFTDAASQVHTGEPVRDHDLDRSQLSTSPQHSLPESETLKADLQHTTNEPLYPTLPRGHKGPLLDCDKAPLAPVINGDALSPIARQAKISTQSPSPAHSTKRSYDDLADSDIQEKHLGSNSKSARHDLTLDHNDHAHDALNDEHFYAKGAIDDPVANHDEEAISPSGKFGAEGVKHEDGRGSQWRGKSGMSSEDYQEIEGDEAPAMNEENVYPLDANGAPIYYDDKEDGFGDLDGKGSFVDRDETPTAHAERTGSEPGDEAFIKNEIKKATNSPSSSPWPRIVKRALDAEGYWGSHPKRARGDSRESSLFITDDEQESRFKHLPTKNVEREVSVQNELAEEEEVSRSPWRYEQREEYEDEEIEYSERGGYPSGSDDEDEGEDEDEDGNEDMDMERAMPGPDALRDSRVDWYHGGQPAVAYPPLDNRGSSLDDAIELDSDSEDEAVSVIQETFQPSIEGSPEPAIQDSLEFRGVNSMQDAQLKSSIDEDDLLEYDSDEAERP